MNDPMLWLKVLGGLVVISGGILGGLMWVFPTWRGCKKMRHDCLESVRKDIAEIGTQTGTQLRAMREDIKEIQKSNHETERWISLIAHDMKLKESDLPKITGR